MPHPLLARLKTETANLHCAVERAVGIPRSEADLVATLERFYGFVAPWESRLERWCAATGSTITAGRWKTPFLERDLNHWGHDSASLSALPRCDRLPEVHCPEDVLGAMYVLEGATLGGRIVARHLRCGLGLSAAGHTYYECYGDRAGARWEEFRQSVAQASSPESDPLIVAAAREMFTCVLAWFC